MKFHLGQAGIYDFLAGTKIANYQEELISGRPNCFHLSLLRVFEKIGLLRKFR